LAKNIPNIDVKHEEEFNYTMGVIILIIILTLVVSAYLNGLV
jgi:hypothetical protein